jgi:UDP-N-acetylmuramoyl-tripeptide--D-alanyl-D-alanine ligase
LSPASALAASSCGLAAVLAGVRWLRVAQREHYQAGRVVLFAARWWAGRPANAATAVVALAGAAASWFWPVAALAVAVAVAGGPWGLSLRGSSSPLRWTRRAATLAAAAVGPAAGLGLAAGLPAGRPAFGAAVAALAAPGAVALASWATAPHEEAIASSYVRRAAQRLAEVRPLVVAVTGSYGKTTTKGYVAHLLSGSRRVVASPASYNNRAGLSRTVNEHLAPGTEVLVAEMGAYGPGEIRELCSWMEPEVSVITAIGPVHLERFKTLERTRQAKAEIAERASTVVLNVDDPMLGSLADELARAGGKKLWRCSATDPAADVLCRPAPDGGALEAFVHGRQVGSAPRAGAAPTNVACALAVAAELGVPAEELAGRLASLPTAPNRLASYRSELGFVVIDDTFNSNPEGARLALATLRATARPGGRAVVVTPGMIELGPRQAAENAAFAAEAARAATDLVVVGRTNRAALMSGAADGLARVVWVPSRKAAVSWVRSHLGPGDAVLYENDLPDHYA